MREHRTPDHPLGGAHRGKPTTDEVERLEQIAGGHGYSRGLNAFTTRYSFEVFARHLRGRSILEMGPAEGVMTELLATTGMDLTLVEGSERFCADLVPRFPRARVEHAVFEAYEPSQRFDNVVLGHVLEHVADPTLVLSRAGEWLTEQGRILAAVPNCRSLHRQAAVIMGLLDSEDSMSDADIAHGHRRVFSPESFRHCFIAANLEIEVFGGYWLKPLSNSQIEECWTTKMLDAFMRLGERYPDIAGEIYVIARRR